jgi:hypothetical protein
MRRLQTLLDNSQEGLQPGGLDWRKSRHQGCRMTPEHIALSCAAHPIQRMAGCELASDGTLDQVTTHAALRLSIHSRTSSARQTVIRSDNLSGLGNSPAFTLRHSVALLKGITPGINCDWRTNPVSGIPVARCEL